MKLRQALIEQGPSLALQRSAQVEIALMDQVLLAAYKVIDEYNIVFDPETEIDIAVKNLYNSVLNFDEETAG